MAALKDWSEVEAELQTRGQTNCRYFAACLIWFISKGLQFLWVLWLYRCLCGKQSKILPSLGEITAELPRTVYADSVKRLEDCQSETDKFTLFADLPFPQPQSEI